VDRKAENNDKMIQTARHIVKEAKTAREIRSGLSVLIPSVCGVTNKEVADVLSISVTAVTRMQKEIRSQVSSKQKNKDTCGVGQKKRFLKKKS